MWNSVSYTHLDVYKRQLKAFVMNFQQLRIIRETIRQGFNLTEVANALHTSQSGVSKHIKDLEDELGVELFIRRGKRLLGLTEPGKELSLIVERILIEVGNIKNVASEFTAADKGELIAVSYTHLDVYKRQHGKSAEGQRYSAAGEKQTAGEGMGHRSSPVGLSLIHI